MSGQDLADRVIAWRRRVHREAELSFAEYRTTELVETELRALGLEPRRFEVGTGVWCDVPAAGDGGAAAVGDAAPLVALRADIDALPMTEETGLEFASATEGVCHACGHDAHTAMLLGAAGLLVADPPPVGVRLIFQPAEETMPGGAERCVAEGVLDGVGQIFALHCDPHRRTGEVGVTDGPVTSSNARIGVLLRASGGHTARPHETGDVVFAAAQVVTGLTAVVDRRVDPRAGAVLTFGSINAGSAVNVIPHRGQVWGTLRGARRSVWEAGEALVRDAVEHLVAPYGVRAEVEYHQGPPPVVNDPACADVARRAVARVLGPDGVGETGQSSGGDDFAWYLDHVPGVYVRFGVWDGRGEQTDLHHPGLRVDEAALADGARLFDAYVREAAAPAGGGADDNGDETGE